MVPLPRSLPPRSPLALEAVGAPAFDQPFLALPHPAESIHHDHVAAQCTVDAIHAFDAHSDVLFVLAHDTSIEPVLGMLPVDLNGWREKGRKEKGAWAFLEEPGNPAFRWQAGPALATKLQDAGAGSLSKWD